MIDDANLGEEPHLALRSWSRRQWKVALIGLTLILGFALILRLALFVGCQGSDDLATWQLATALSEGLLKPELILQNPIATNRYGAAIPTAAIFAIFGNNESTLMIYPVLVSLIALLAVWDIVRRLTGNMYAAHFAGLVMAITSLDIHYATVSLPDGPMTNVSLIAIWCAVVGTGEGWRERLVMSRSLLFACGLLASFAFLHKESAAQLVLGLGMWGVVQIFNGNYRHGLFIIPAGFLLGFLGEHLLFLVAYDDFFHRWDVIVTNSAANAVRHAEIQAFEVSYGGKLLDFSRRMFERFPSMTMLIISAAYLSLVTLLREFRHRAVTLVACYGLAVLATRFLEMTQTYSFQPRRFLPFAGCAAILFGYWLWRNRSARKLMVVGGLAFLIALGMLLIKKDSKFSLRDRHRVAASRWLHQWIKEHPDALREHGLYVDVRTAKLLYALSGFTPLHENNIRLYASSTDAEHAFFGMYPDSYKNGAYFFENPRLMDWLLPRNYQSGFFEIYRVIPESWQMQSVFAHPSSTSYNAALYRIAAVASETQAWESIGNLAFDPASDSQLENGDGLRFGWNFEGVIEADTIECIVADDDANTSLHVDLEAAGMEREFRMFSGEGNFWDPPASANMDLKAGDVLRLRWPLKRTLKTENPNWIDGRLRIRGFDAKGEYVDLYNRRLRLYYDEQQLRGYVVVPRDLVSLRVLLDLSDAGSFEFTQPIFELYRDLFE